MHIFLGALMVNLSDIENQDLLPCSTQLSMKFIQQINVKMPNIVVIFTFMSRMNTTSDSFKAEKVSTLVLWSVEISCSVELSMEKVL